MAFDKKAWEDANREKVKLYALRYRLKKRGLEAPPLPALSPEEREAKRLAAKERQKEAKRKYDLEHREEKARRYRERYANDPEFKASRNVLRRKYYQEKKTAPSDADKEATRRRRQEALAKARKILNAKRHEEAIRRAAEMEIKKQQKRAAPHPNSLGPSRKPGRLLALCGWKGL